MSSGRDFARWTRIHAISGDSRTHFGISEKAHDMAVRELVAKGEKVTADKIIERATEIALGL